MHCLIIIVIHESKRGTSVRDKLRGGDLIFFHLRVKVWKESAESNGKASIFAFRILSLDRDIPLCVNWTSLLAIDDIEVEVVTSKFERDIKFLCIPPRPTLLAL